MKTTSAAKANRRADIVDRLEAESARLRAALESLTEDPPSTLDEPDEDWEVIIKMRAIARARLKGDTRPIEVIVREARDAWPDHPQPNLEQWFRCKDWER